MANDLIHQTDIKFAPFDAWHRISGMSKTKTYLAITDGHIRAVKLGDRTLIDVESGLAYMRSLPPAVIRIQSRPKPKPAQRRPSGSRRASQSAPQPAA
jgi:hypothetical protein